MRLVASYLSGVDGGIVGGGHDVALLANVHALGEGAFACAVRVGKDVGDVLHLGCLELFDFHHPRYTVVS